MSGTRKIIDGATADGDYASGSRLGDRARWGLWKAYNGGTGSCTAELIDKETGAVAATLALSATKGAVVDVLIPAHYSGRITATSGSVTVDAWVDGDG